MLSQNFIPTRTPQATELVAGTHELIAELQERLSAGESFDNPKLTESPIRVLAAHAHKVGTHHATPMTL